MYSFFKGTEYACAYRECTAQCGLRDPQRNHLRVQWIRASYLVGTFAFTLVASCSPIGLLQPWQMPQWARSSTDPFRCEVYRKWLHLWLAAHCVQRLANLQVGFAQVKSNLGSCRFKATMTWIQKKVQRSVVHSVFDLEAEWVPLRKCRKMICDHWNRCSNQGIVWLDTRRSGKSSVWKRILSAKNLRTFTLHPSIWTMCVYMLIFTGSDWTAWDVNRFCMRWRSEAELQPQSQRRKTRQGLYRAFLEKQCYCGI